MVGAVCQARPRFQGFGRTSPPSNLYPLLAEISVVTTDFHSVLGRLCAIIFPMDRLDYQLIRALQAQGRMANVDLARLCDSAPSTTLERVRRLEEKGVIKGYRAVLDPQAVGLAVQALVLISLDHHQAGPIDEFEDRVRAVPEVMACYHLTGR